MGAIDSLKFAEYQCFLGEKNRGNTSLVVQTCALSPADMKLLSIKKGKVSIVFVQEGQLYFYFAGIAVALCVHSSLAGLNHLVRFSEAKIYPDEAITLTTQVGRKVSLRHKQDRLYLTTQAFNLSLVTNRHALIQAIVHDPAAEVYYGNDVYFLILDSAAQVSTFTPPIKKMKEHKLCLCITALAEAPQYDYCSRYFAPSYGQDEDLATGSAHIGLAQLWWNKMKIKQAKAIQLSAARTVIYTDVTKEHVEVSGYCKPGVFQ